MPEHLSRTCFQTVDLSGVSSSSVHSAASLVTPSKSPLQAPKPESGVTSPPEKKAAPCLSYTFRHTESALLKQLKRARNGSLKNLRHPRAKYHLLRRIVYCDKLNIPCRPRT